MNIIDKLKIKDLETTLISVDKMGRIFFYENRIFRAINDSHKEQVQDMFNGGLINELTDKKLFPRTWISDVEIEGYSLVVEHEKIPHWNYPYEWSFDMLKDAALTILKVNKIANKYGYETLDAHAYNVVFNMNRPQYIDLGSFNPTTHSWTGLELFYKYFFYPLYLWSKGYSSIARNLYLQIEIINETELFRFRYPLSNVFGKHKAEFFFNKLYSKYRSLASSSKDKVNEKIKNSLIRRIVLLFKSIANRRYSIRSLERKIMRQMKPKGVSMWSDYHDDIHPDNNKRFIRITEIIKELKDATSMIEVGSNQGKYASYILENTHINKIIATDYDKEAVNIMYNNNKGKSNFLSLLFDMVATNGTNYDKHIKYRIKSDIVQCLAVTHHLILTQAFNIDYIFKVLNDLTNKYVIVEFMPIGLYSGDLNNTPPTPDFYNLEWFKSNFENYFDLILDEKLELNRHVFVGSCKQSSQA